MKAKEFATNVAMPFYSRQTIYIADEAFLLKLVSNIGSLDSKYGTIAH